MTETGTRAVPESLHPVAETEQTLALSALSAGREAGGANGFREPTGAARDPWAEPTESAPSSAQGGPRTPAGSAADPTHDPHEVTVQLDAVQLGDVRLSAVAGAARGTDPDGPVFVDESGRRSRRFRRLGLLAAVACAAYAVVIVATLMSGSSDAPWLPVPGQHEEKPAGQVGTSPLPRASDAGTPPETGAATGPAAPPTASATAGPGAETTRRAGTSGPAAGTSGPAAGASAETGGGSVTHDSPSASASSAGASPAPSTPRGSASSVPSPSAPGRTGTPGGRHRHPYPKITL